MNPLQTLILFLIFPFTLASQDQVTDIYSPRHNEVFKKISKGDLNGEAITMYLDYRRLFVDFENESMDDFHIPYEMGCYQQHHLYTDRYYYINSRSTLVFDLLEKKVLDHFTFLDDWTAISIQEINGLLVSKLSPYQQEVYRFGVYNPTTKQQSTSLIHDKVFIHDKTLYYSDKDESETTIGIIDLQNQTETIIYQGTELVYLGDGIFRDATGILVESVLEGNPTYTCNPLQNESQSLLATKIYVQDNYRLLEAYDRDTLEYIYFGEQSCEVFQLFNSVNQTDIDFFNEANFGFSALGKYFRVRHNPNYSGLYFQFGYVCDEPSNINDSWIMFDAYAYYLSRKYFTGQYSKRLYKYTPATVGSPLESDTKKLIKILPDTTNIIAIANDSIGNIDLTINSINDGVFTLKLDSEGNEISRTYHFSPIYHDRDYKNANWRAYKGGYQVTHRISDTDLYRLDRIEGGILLSPDTVLMQSYIDDEITVSLRPQGDDVILRFDNHSSSTTTDVLNPPISPNFSSRIINVADEFWYYTTDTDPTPNVIVRYNREGDFLGTLSTDVYRKIYHNDDGMIFTASLGDYRKYIFHFDGDDLKQLSDIPIVATRFVRSKDNQYIISGSNGEHIIFQYDPIQKLLFEKERISGHLEKTNSLHSSQQEDIVFSVFNNVDSSDDIKNLVFSDGNYRIEEFDLDEMTYVTTHKTLPINGGYVYSIYHNQTNVYVDSNGIANDIPIDYVDEFVIEDIVQTENANYLLGFSYHSSYVYKCDTEFNDCITIKDFDSEDCQNNYKIELLGRNNNEAYLGSVSGDPLQTIWTLDLTTDEMYHYNNNVESQIKFFDKRLFHHKGHVYFSASKSDGTYQLFRIQVSESPNATKEKNNEKVFVVYPNPTAGYTTITSLIDLDQVIIYNSQGAEVDRGIFQDKRSYLLPELPSGYYILVATNGGHRYRSSLVIID